MVLPTCVEKATGLSVPLYIRAKATSKKGNSHSLLIQEIQGAFSVENATAAKW